MKNPLGVAFITFRSIEMAYVALLGCAINQKEEDSDQFYIPDLNWSLTYAPYPSNIIWENVHTTRTKYWIIYITVFIIFMCLVVVFSAPAIILTQIGIDKLLNDRNLTTMTHLDRIIRKFFPSLLLVVLTGLLPALVLFSNIFVPFSTKSDYYNSIMIKLFVYLVLMIVMVPTTEYMSLLFLPEDLISNPENLVFREECIAISKYATFFSVYLIQCALITVSVQLLRIPEVSFYLLLLCGARSQAERYSIRRKVDTEFPVGMHYAYILTNIAISIVFLTLAPLVAPLGLLYLCMKHLIDRYNLFFAYSSPHSGKYCHAAAINLTISIYLVQSLICFGYHFIRSRAIELVGIIYIFNILLTGAVVLAQYIIPDRHFLQVFTLPHTKRRNEYRQSIGGRTLQSSGQSNRLWSVYEIQSEVYASQKYLPEVLEGEDEFEAEFIFAEMTEEMFGLEDEDDIAKKRSKILPPEQGEVQTEQDETQKEQEKGEEQQNEEKPSLETEENKELEAENEELEAETQDKAESHETKLEDEQNKETFEDEKNEEQLEDKNNEEILEDEETEEKLEDENIEERLENEEKLEGSETQKESYDDEKSETETIDDETQDKSQEVTPIVEKKVDKSKEKYFYFF